jgi:tetratricopeptide (TPR) repeat protein
MGGLLPFRGENTLMRVLRHFLVLVIAAAAGLNAASLQEVKQLRSQGNLDAAKNMLSEVLAADPDNAQAHYEMGGILIEQKDFTGAEGEFTRVEELGSAGLALIGKGRVRLAQEQAPEAKELLNRAQEQTPAVQELLDQVATADSDEGKAAARVNADNSADLYYSRGLTNALLRDYAASAADLEASIRLNPANAKAHYYAGLAYNALKRPDMMVSHFQTYLSMQPEGPESDRVRSVLRGVR